MAPTEGVERPRIVYRSSQDSAFERFIHLNYLILLLRANLQGIKT